MYNRFVQSMTANAKVATVLGSIPASSDTVESEGRQMKQCWKQYIVHLEIPEGTNRCWLHRVQHSTSICMVNFIWELTDYEWRTRYFAVAWLLLHPHPPATQRENILKGSLPGVFSTSWFCHESVSPGPLVYHGGHFEFLRKFVAIFKSKG